MTAFALMIPLAFTSTRGWIRRMGGKRWQKLHRLIYFSAAAGVIHFLWLVKADRSRPIAYGSVLAVLLLFRIAIRMLGRTRPRPVNGIMVSPALSGQSANPGDGPI
jgi:sulfoxide reductase heme-binding subunit YedZ